MADYLFIELTEDASHATWAAFDAQGRLLSTIGRGELTSVRPGADGHRVVLLAPATAVISTQAELPTASAARLRQMLPYSLNIYRWSEAEELFIYAFFITYLLSLRMRLMERKRARIAPAG